MYSVRDDLTPEANYYQLLRTILPNLARYFSSYDDLIQKCVVTLQSPITAKAKNANTRSNNLVSITGKASSGYYGTYSFQSGLPMILGDNTGHTDLSFTGSLVSPQNFVIQVNHPHSSINANNVINTVLTKITNKADLDTFLSIHWQVPTWLSRLTYIPVDLPSDRLFGSVTYNGVQYWTVPLYLGSEAGFLGAPANFTTLGETSFRKHQLAWTMFNIQHDRDIVVYLMVKGT